MFKLNATQVNPKRDLLISKFGRAEVDDTLGWSEQVFYDGDGQRSSPYLSLIHI